MSHRDRSSVNYGIQADAVKGDAIAVGTGAHAEVAVAHETQAIEVEDAIKRFLLATAPVEIPSIARAELDRRLNLVRQEMASSHPKSAAVSEHLKEAGTIVDSVAKIVEGGLKLVAPFGVVVASVSAAISLLR